MFITYTYRIYPTRRQSTLLKEQIDICRRLYNYLLRQRKIAWHNNLEVPTLQEQKKQITFMRKTQTDAQLQLVHSQVLQAVAHKLHLHHSNYIKNRRKGIKTGPLRYKSKSRYNSMTFPQAYRGGCFIRPDGKLYVAKVGCIKIVQHRKMNGTVKTATIKQSTSGKWFVSFVVEKDNQLKAEKQQNASINTSKTIQLDETIEIPKFILSQYKKIKKHKITLNKRKEIATSDFTSHNKNSFRRKEKHYIKAKEKLANQKKDFIYKQTKTLLTNTTHLEINIMENITRDVMNPRAIIFRELLKTLEVKAAEAGLSITTNDFTTLGQQSIEDNIPINDTASVADTKTNIKKQQNTC